MDTSKTYIKMCDWPKIQGTRELGRGDFFAILKTPIDDGCLDVRIVGDQKMWMIAHRSVWLPRQDQLQEMIKSYYKTHPSNAFECDDFGLVEYFYNFCWLEEDRNWDKEGITTMEQFWLVFVMKEKHNKIWNGEEWDEITN